MEMFKIIKGKDKISEDELYLFNRVGSDRTRGHSLRVKKRGVKMEVRSGTFIQRVVNALNGLPEKVVAAEAVGKFKLSLDRYLEVIEIERNGDVDSTFR